MHWSSQKCLEFMIISTAMSCTILVCAHCIYHWPWIDMMILEKFVDWYSEDITVRCGELWRAGLGSAGCQVWYYDIMSIVQGLEYQRKPRLVHFSFSLFWKIFSVMVMLIYCKDYISGCVNFSFNCQSVSLLQAYLLLELSSSRLLAGTGGNRRQPAATGPLVFSVNRVVMR